MKDIEMPSSKAWVW